MSYYRDQLETWLKTINIKAERVLDLGGAANPVTNRLGSFEANEYVCFDNGKEEAKVQYINFDINESLSKLGYDEKSFKFDCIFCLEVFEYVWNPVQAIDNIYNLLMPDGFAYISFPSIYPVHNPEEIDYLRYTKKAIEKYMDLVGLVIKSIQPRVATAGWDELSGFYSKEGMHPVRGSKLPFHIGYLVKVNKLMEATQNV